MRRLTALGRALPVVLCGVVGLAADGCASAEDTGEGSGTTPSSGGSGQGGSTGEGGDGGAIGPCADGDTQPCYTGPPSTQGLGECKDGVTTCSSGVFGACMGEQLPGTEVCDTKDNSCNGVVDEGCSCDEGQTQACYTGPAATKNTGKCVDGIQGCAGGIWSMECAGEVTPVAETCDGSDENCDGSSDEGNPGGGSACQTGQMGACAAGTMTCVAAALACVGNVGPAAEQCNSQDDDCNGSVDDGNPGGGQPCSTGMAGVCAPGTMVCTNGAVACKQNIAPSGEACDSQDNDCNGQVDEGNPGGGACNTGQPGICASGTATCINGQLPCMQNNSPQGESCNNEDDDCDGQTDEDCVCGCCPYVLAHDGSGWAYETSAGGAALIGHAEHERGGKQIDYEPLLLRLDRAATAQGEVRAKILAAEDEIVYLDEAHLVAIDHPADHELVSSSAIHWPTMRRHDASARDPGEIWALSTSAMRAPGSALWMGDVDATASLSSIDDEAAPFDRRRDNFYELDFGDVVDARHARLVIDGWKTKEDRRLDPAIETRPPRLLVRQLDGSWREAIGLAAPRGDRKTVAFDLSSVEFPTGRYEMRLYVGTHDRGTSMWYLDRVRLTEAPPAPIRTTRIASSSATLAFAGTPTVEHPDDPSRPRLCKDDGAGDASDPRTYGRFTRYGDVTELLGAPDDRPVVMRRGDGVEIAFRDLPAAAAGTVRTFFLSVELLFKRRAGAGHPEPTRLTERVEPMPFHGMSRYPYGPSERFPDGELHAGYLARYQTRVESPARVAATTGAACSACSA